MSVQTSTKMLTKMPDPPMLRDGKDAKFKAWKTDMKRKLLLNEDHCPKTAPRLAYVNSSCEGKALRHISPRLPLPASLKTFVTIYNAYSTSQPEAGGSRRITFAENGPKSDFMEFLAEFTHYAEEWEQP